MRKNANYLIARTHTVYPKRKHIKFIRFIRFITNTKLRYAERAKTNLFSLFGPLPVVGASRRAANGQRSGWKRRIEFDLLVFDLVVFDECLILFTLHSS